MQKGDRKLQLVIAEKPSVARNIAKVLHATNVKDGYLEGKEYLVSWCIGHLIELVSADQYRDDWKAWRYETLPMIPENWKYQIKESTKGQFQILKELLLRADVTEIICATDAGREGELIFRLVYNQAECKLPFKRLWISSMEEKAILEGFQQMKDGHEYDNLYYSAVARSEADWLVGINATRLFTVLYHHRLIVGRVQTPTLAMLVEREKNIENFQKEKYYLVHLLMDGLDAVSSRIKEKSTAVQMMEDMKDETAQILSVKKEKKKVQPPKLYDLTTLQREANRLLGFTAQQTLDYTQSLYEKKLVTYPRTDSRYLTDDMEGNTLLVVGAVNSMFPEMSIKGSEPEIKRLLNSKKVSDHHAIIPTVEIANMDLKALPGGEKEILMLIASKLLCASEQEYIYESINTEISCHTLEINWDYHMPFDGFKKYLMEKGILNYSLIIDKEGEKEKESRTLKAAREIGLDNLAEGASTEHPGLRIADMLAGIIAKLLKGLCDSLRYQSIEESTDKKILDTGWFRLNEAQLELYKKLYWLICEWQPAWYKSYSGIYSDDLILFNSLLNFMNHFESVEQIQADLDMQGEYFNAFACKQLMKYFDRRKNKLPIEPVIPFDKESYLNQRGGKVYYDSRKQLLLPLHEGSQTFEVLSVGVDQKFTPTVTILKDGKSECFRLPDELSEWASSVVGMASMGINFFPAKVAFSNIDGRYYVDIL